jgi:DNA-binding transcriptional ArsR family regulator
MLSDPTRLMILHHLMTNGEQKVSQVVEATGSTQANVSKHLKQLAEVRLVARRREGLNVRNTEASAGSQPTKR